jgi:hypothetical protein
MTGLKGPNSIPGLNLWFDAADINTINNGRVVYNENVYKFVDKISNVPLTNLSGVSGPSYSFNAVNEKNAISFVYYTTPNNRVLKSLKSSGISQFDTSTYSLFLVYKPTNKTWQDDVTLGSESYILNIWDGQIAGRLPTSTFPNRAFFLGDSLSATTAGRRNPSGRWLEGNQTTSPGYFSWIYTEEQHSRSLEEPTPVGLSGPSSFKTTIASARVQNGLRKIGWMKEGSENLEDTVLPIAISSRIPAGLSALGSPRPPSPYTQSNYYLRSSDLSRISYRPTPLNSSVLVLGAFAPITNTITGGAYPFEGFICELLHYDRYLNDQETNSIREYLDKKWFRI